ncbi:excalibur calcium-binding domain-containing protein [Streptomyces sp. NPDC060184]|uniref:excalibur calcium-binding domain-containing protein n=1 Tax=Streptomyces sp. NPDC060184 TaxID=3347064 RepID=UPI00364F3FB3
MRVTVAPEPEPKPEPAHADDTRDDASNGSAENGTSRTSDRPHTSGSGGAGAHDGTSADDAPAGTATSYANCTAVRAAGAAPIHRGEPGFGAHLDRDGDGVACE